MEEKKYLLDIINKSLKKKKKSDAALLIDGFGLKERVVTAYDHLEEEDIISNMQRADAAARLKEMEPSIKIKMNITKFIFLNLKKYYLRSKKMEFGQAIQVIM